MSDIYLDAHPITGGNTQCVGNQKLVEGSSRGGLVGLCYLLYLPCTLLEIDVTYSCQLSTVYLLGTISLRLPKGADREPPINTKIDPKCFLANDSITLQRGTTILNGWIDEWADRWRGKWSKVLKTVLIQFENKAKINKFLII